MHASDMPLPHWLRRPGALLLALAGAWLLVALLLALQGQLASRYRGVPQPWWPSFGYTLAICAVWALITPALVGFVRQSGRRVRRPGARILLYAAGLPLANLAQVALFAGLFWPWFNDGGRIASRWAMAERMITLNLHTNALFYLVLVVGTALLAARRPAAEPAQARAEEVRPAEAPEAIRIGGRGRVTILPIARIEWIGAAGNYAEIHSAEGSFLADESLGALAARLPAERFARIHRGAIVRLDRIEAVRSLGRGDALVRLTGGTELRLSRRYRPNLREWLDNGG